MDYYTPSKNGDNATADRRKPKTKKGSRAVHTKSVADRITRNEHFARDAGGGLYRFADGTYKARAELFVQRRVKAILNEQEAGDEWTSRLAKEVIEYIKVDAPELWERPPTDEVCVQNGLLKLWDRVLKPHSPEFLSPVQLPCILTRRPSAPPSTDASATGFPAIRTTWLTRFPRR